MCIRKKVCKERKFKRERERERERESEKRERLTSLRILPADRKGVLRSSIINIPTKKSPMPRRSWEFYKERENQKLYTVLIEYITSVLSTYINNEKHNI